MFMLSYDLSVTVNCFCQLIVLRPARVADSFITCDLAKSLVTQMKCRATAWILERKRYTTNLLLGSHVYWTLLSNEQIWEQRRNSLVWWEINLQATFYLQAKQIKILGKMYIWRKYLIFFKMIDRINLLKRWVSTKIIPALHVLVRTLKEKADWQKLIFWFTFLD